MLPAERDATSTPSGSPTTIHIVEDVLREIRQDLPQGYDQELPKLSGGPGHGYPRVYALALALVAHTDSELDEARITRLRPGLPRQSSP